MMSTTVLLEDSFGPLMSSKLPRCVCGDEYPHNVKAGSSFKTYLVVKRRRHRSIDDRCKNVTCNNGASLWDVDVVYYEVLRGHELHTRGVNTEEDEK
jgi:hypothetical protein